MNPYQRMLMWVYIIGLVCVAIIIFAGDASAQDTESWDWTPTVLRDNTGQLLVQKRDPVGDGIAYFTYKTVVDEKTNVLVVVYTRVGNVCRIGQRSVEEGVSVMSWTHSSCSFFDKIHEMYKKHLNKPLEALNE